MDRDCCAEYACETCGGIMLVYESKEEKRTSIDLTCPPSRCCAPRTFHRAPSPSRGPTEQEGKDASGGSERDE